MSLLKEAVRNTMSRVVVWTGMTAVGRKLFPKDGTMILYGHRIADDEEGYLQGVAPSDLDGQLAYLARNYEIIALRELTTCLEEGRPVPRRSVVLTFDDGFRDNLDPGATILARHHAPATVFVVTGSLTSGDLPWSQRLGVLFQQTAAREFCHELAGPKPFDLSSAALRHGAYLAVKERVRQMPREARECTLREISRALEVEPPRDRMLSWNEARELLSLGIDVGAHTYSHSLLALVPPEEARWEIERCLYDLREQLGIEHPAFCFPAGSMTGALVDLVRELGFRSVFQRSHGERVNSEKTVDPFSLRRIGLPNGPSVELEAELDGPFERLREATRWAKKGGRR